MNKRLFLSIFENEDDVMAAVKALRRAGYSIVDIYAPYAVHGLDRAAGFRPTRLPIICFVLGLLGATLKVWFQVWTSAVNWPINVGGKPWNSLPAFVPVTFEVMVLLAGVGTVIALFIAARLYPGKTARNIYPGTTDDRFAVVIEERDATFNPVALRALCEKYRAVHTEEREEVLEYV